MKTAWTLLSLNLLVIALVVAGIVLFLAATHRLNSERLHRAAGIFKPTLSKEQDEHQAAQKQQADQVALAADATRRNEIAGGNSPLNDRLEQRQQASDLASQRIERLEREKTDLLRQLQLAEDRIAKSQGQLDAQHAALAQAAAAQDKKIDGANFQATIEMLEQLNGRQTKEIFQNLLRANKTQQVVDYLAAMQIRKAAAVLKEFKTPAEIADATQLLEMLRRRGVDPLPQAKGGSSTPANESTPAPAPAANRAAGGNSTSQAPTLEFAKGARA